MIWHILVIILGALTAISAVCPFWGPHVLFGVLVIIFGILALMRFRKRQNPGQGRVPVTR